MQAPLVALIVAACAVYATWSLMPAVWRRSLAQHLRRWPVLGRWGALRRAAGGAGPGCGGCGDCGETPIRVLRRPR